MDAVEAESSSDISASSQCQLKLQMTIFGLRSQPSYENNRSVGQSICNIRGELESSKQILNIGQFDFHVILLLSCQLC